MDNKNFWNDGVSQVELEKVVMLFLFSIGSLLLFYQYVLNGEINSTMANFVIGLGSLTVVRKGVSYIGDKINNNTENKSEYEYIEDLEQEVY